MDRPLAFSLECVNEIQSHGICIHVYIQIYGCFVLKSFGKLFTTAYFDIVLIIATCLQISNDQLHYKLFVITLHAASMFNFHNIITFEHVQVYRLTIIFQIFLYFPSHKISVNRFPSHYSSMLCLHQLSFIYGFVGRKNHKNTKYVQIFNLLFLYSKNVRIYIIPVNYDLYIIWSQPPIYTELQLYTTRKVVNRMNDIQIMFYNLLLFLHSWIAFLFIITMINCMFIVRYFTIKPFHLILGQIFIWGYEKEMWEWIISNCFEMLI